jgi:outer membrane lipoprotein-sorting protein
MNEGFDPSSGSGDTTTTDDSTPADGASTDDGSSSSSGGLSDLSHIFTPKALKSYELTIVTEDQKIKQLVKAKAGVPVRIRMKDDGNDMLYLVDKQEMYVIDHQEDTVTRLAWDDPGTVPSPPSAQESRRRVEAAPEFGITSGKLKGMDCWVVTFADPEEGKMQIWVDKRYHLTRQMKGPDDTITFDYDKINAVPDKEFEIPASYKVVDLADMGHGAMKNMPEGITLPTR